MLRNLSLKGALRQTMDRLIRTQDVKSLMLGAAGVAAVGLLLGAAMQPDLRAPGDAEGAQLQAGVSGPRAYGLADAGAAWTSYANGIPDYVIGADWLQPPQYDTPPPPDEAFADDASAYAFDEPAYAPAAVARYEEAPREPTRYPSMDGGQAFAAQAVAAAATAAVATEPMETSLDPEAAELAAATPG
ncbi:hypothetical protein LRS10_20775 [Phenylobacterium sp. J426]|uniref:hypothetical protein n=1 Tax=Phenylobacterium sp. J426 TaxID=2898439 RepID=UPI00215165D4|nr:hypothetical protein [Phenylobacterium sp. J426]MCR5876364.1 hypothetical protein [Phenylobacterium sp. J426]